MATDQTYNGWTNYATWRVSLEMFSNWDHEAEGIATADYIREIAEDAIEIETVPGLARDYARAFLSEVNWYEIATHLNEDNPFVLQAQ